MSYVNQYERFSSLFMYQRVRKSDLISFLMSVLYVRPFVVSQGTTRLQLDGFSLNLTFEYFSKICKFKFH